MAKARAKKAASKKAPATKKPAPKKVPATRAAASETAPAQPAARETPKVSPMRSASVDAWAKEMLTRDQQAILAALVELVAEEAEGAENVIKWAQPVWELNGPFAYFRPSTAHVTFGFWRGAELDDPEGLLQGGERMKHVKLRAVHEARKPAVRKFVRHAAKLNRAKGDPTKR